MVLATYKWTNKKYHQAIDSGIFSNESVELLRGDIVVMAPEREPHAYYNTEVADHFRNLLQSRAKIRDAKPITLPNDSEPQPDIAIVHPLGQEYLRHHPYPANIFLIIEFSQATLSKDLGEKKDIYAEAGIMEYWVVDIKNAQLTVFRDLWDGQYQSKQTLTSGTIPPLAFPDVSVPVQQLIHP
ncbi:Uma2 family endonuclease [Synechocystis sp. FACHB-383]|uniref:Uma2 family endonuclease n=1 Tax=Synechocystis sp. FACHB-383 TaxID=2692864 RepID=UPI0016871C06|nr:Uma2 family endonuclease [Synechocystis sp. FACHB-383]MBD2654436.1 Uma2 family endonuclease [Synechocystis sp. FACHB-383]